MKNKVLKHNKTALIFSITLTVFVLVFLTLMRKLGIIFAFPGRDYLTQHVVFLDNMRINFENTHELFPQLNMNLGMMSSYANYYYHWSTNLWTYLSYLYPFSTTSYIVVVWSLTMGMFFYGCFQLLSYYTDKLKTKLTVALIFTISGVIVMMFQYHIIFVLGFGFLPYLYIGCHKIVYEKKSSVFIVSFILIILSSLNILLSAGFISLFYLIILYIYSDKAYSKTKLALIMLRNYILIIAITAINLVPFLIRSLNMGRAVGTKNPLTIFNEMFLYDITFNSFVFGISFIAIISVFYVIIKRKHEARLIAIMVLVLFVFPIFSYIFNFFQYQNSKAYSVLLPLIAILFMKMLENESKKYSLKHVLGIVTVLFITSVLIVNKYFPDLLGHTLLADLPNSNIMIGIIAVFSITYAFILFKYNKKFFSFLFLSVYIVANTSIYMIPSDAQYIIDNTISSNDKSDEMVDNFNNLHTYNDKLVNQIASGYSVSPSVYSSVITPSYQDFISNVYPMEHARSLNYIEYNSSYLDDLIFANTANNNTNTLPLIRGSYNNYNQELSAVNQDVVALALLQGNFVNTGDKTYDEIEMISLGDLNIDVNSEFDDINNLFDIPIPTEDSTLILSFDINKTSCNTTMNMLVNGIENRRSACDYIYYNNNNHFTYVVDAKANKDIKYQISEGKWKIENIEYLVIANKNLDEMISDYAAPTNTSIDLNDSITTHLKMEEDGYLITSIPYDEGFKLYIDGVETEIEVVNNSFIGSQLAAGEHEIRIEYEIPGFKLGRNISIVGLILLLCLAVYDNRIKLKRKTLESN